MLWIELCSLKIQVSKSYPVAPQNVTIFGERAIKEVIKVKEDH